MQFKADDDLITLPSSIICFCVSSWSLTWGLCFSPDCWVNPNKCAVTQSFLLSVGKNRKFKRLLTYLIELLKLDYNVSPTQISLTKPPFGGKSVVWGRYNLTRSNDAKRDVLSKSETPSTTKPELVMPSRIGFSSPENIKSNATSKGKVRMSFLCFWDPCVIGMNYWITKS